MSDHVSFATLFDAFGLYLEQVGASDVLVNQIEGGFLLGFTAADEQRVVTLDPAEITRLQANAAQHKEQRGGFRIFGRRTQDKNGLRDRLRAVGRFLDERRAEGVVIQEREGGFSTEFTSVPSDAADLRSVHRLVETLDDDALRPLR